MHVGVVIPAYNVAPWIAQAVRSVIEQTHRDWLMFIVDDGSTDQTPEILAGISDPRIVPLWQTNQGVSAARNCGIAAAADAEALLFLDADDWLAPDALATLAATLAAAPLAVAAAGGYTRVVGDGSRHPTSVSADGDILRRLLVRNLFINGGHLLIRRTAIARAGQFDPSLQFGEDWHYWIRIATSGPFVTVPGAAQVLFLRERPGSAYLSMAWNPERFQPCLAAVYADQAVRQRFAPDVLATLRRQAEAEQDWVIGRELIRHGRAAEGRAWLTRSLRLAPSVKRFALLCGSWARIGPFRPYAASASTSRRDTAFTGIAA